LDAGANFKPDMGTVNFDARDAYDESRKDEKRNQAFHYLNAFTTTLTTY